KPQGYVLRFSVRGAQGWSAPKTIARGANWFVSDADVPSLAVLSDGTLAADWFVASVGPRSEAYDVNLVLSKDGGTTWSKPLMPHRDGKKRQHGFVSMVPTPDAKWKVYVLMSGDSGKTFGKKIRIDDGNPIGRVDVVSRSSGAAVVSWVERTSQGAQVRVREVAANGTAAAPMNVSGTAGLGSGVFPRMVRSGDDIVVAWTDASKPAQIRTVVVR